jgi:hypothetical protein
VTSTRPQTQGGPLITMACDCFAGFGGNGVLNAGTGTVEFGPSTNNVSNFRIGTPQFLADIVAGLFRIVSVRRLCESFESVTAGG